MKNTKKIFIIATVILVLVIVISLITVNTDTSITEVSRSPYSKCGFTITSIEPNSKVYFPLTIEGVVDNSHMYEIGCSWQRFEGQAGTAELYANIDNQGWKMVGAHSIITVDDWMAVSTDFEATFDFDNSVNKIPNNTPMKIVFTEEDPSGRGLSNTIDFPVVYQYE